MNSTALHDRFRSDTRDVEEPPLWTSSEIYQYINDAQIMFTRLTGGIADATSSITQLPISVGQVFVDLSPKILKIRQAVRLSDYRDVELKNIEDFQRSGYDRYPNAYGTGQRFSRLDSTTGPIHSLVLGMEANKARIVDIPLVADTIALTVYRMPLEEITAKDQDLEIDEQHHQHLLLWVKRCAHMKQDAETFDRGRSENFEAQFMAYCQQAKLERERREHKFRTIEYGGY